MKNMMLLCAAILFGSIGCNMQPKVEDGRQVPPISDVTEMKAKMYSPDKDTLGKQITFVVPKEHWQPIYDNVVPADVDPAPAKWEWMGELTISLNNGESRMVFLFNLDGPKGAFAAGTNWKHRQYYRGGNSAQLKQALLAAYEASKKKTP
jgi:hypothetical protein